MIKSKSLFGDNQLVVSNLYDKVSCGEALGFVQR